MDSIRVTKVETGGNRIVCTVKTEGDVSRAFRKSSFKSVFESSIPLDGLPESVAVIPLMGTLLPLSWLFDASLEVGSLDADFAGSIPDIKKGYKDMYPDIPFKGDLKVGEVIENHTGMEGKALSLFSGGLDSHYTALSHSDEKPDLLILRGADISILPKDDEGWEEILSQVDKLAGTIGADRLSAVTDFRRYVDYRFLNPWTTDVAGEGASYWVCFQHGLGLLAHAAPFAYLRGIDKIYIASSYTEEEEGRVKCASDPSIDEKVHFCGASVAHDGYDAGRSDKLKAVCEWAEAHDTDLYLRVCHTRPEMGRGSKTGKNCCRCEKCFRTILGLVALKEDPKRYGFDIGDPDEYYSFMHGHVANLTVRHFNTRYLPIIKLMRENYEDGEIPESLRWMYDFSLGEDSEFFSWVDQRIAVQHERITASESQQKALERENERLRQEVSEYKEKYEELKKEMDGSILHRLANRMHKQEDR